MLTSTPPDVFPENDVRAHTATPAVRRLRRLSAPRPRATPPARPRTVLIVEDNELNMKLFSDLLTVHGYTVVEARDGRSALPMARKHAPDLILMDIQLPELSGLEVTEVLKADVDCAHIPVIAVTAYAMRGDEERIKQGGFEAYLSKPISLAGFIATIQKYIGSARPEGMQQ